jgi:hypothetical protein
LVRPVYGFGSKNIQATPTTTMTRAMTTAASKSGQYKAPLNQFAQVRTYVDPDFKDVVRISVNSLWTFGFIDLEKEPFVYSQPDTHGRFILMQALNMRTDDFASTGSRATGTGVSNFLILGPNWKGSPPSDVKATFRCSTRYAWTLVQISVGSPADFDEIHKLQEQLQLTPLGAWGKPYAPPEDVPVDPNVDLTATPYDAVRLRTGEMFFRRLALLLKENPPYEEDADGIEKLRRIGAEAGKEYDVSKLNPGLARGVNDAPAEVWLKLAEGPCGPPPVASCSNNGWLNPPNLGHFGNDYNTRALVAWLGLGALTSDDCVYPSAFVDADGNVLDGTKKYIFHLAKDEIFPSESGAWSVSPYRGNFYVRNAMNRHGVLSSMPLKYNADGSLDIYIQ